MKRTCHACFRRCILAEGQTGACGARKNTGGGITASNYGRLTSLALDPIEKKPLARFYPGSRILSVGSYGCNLRCPFCQNYEIATAREALQKSPGGIDMGQETAAAREASSAALRPQPLPVEYLEAGGGGRSQLLETAAYSPEELCGLALGLRGRGNIGIAFTYNEPLVGYEFVRDTAGLFHENGMKTVLVTNGTASPEVLEEILPLIDAMNIDLKGFAEEFYRDFVGGSLQMAKDFIARAADHCHVELTKLIIPGKNDGEEEMRRMAAWIASLRGGKGSDIPLHVTRYFPRYKSTEPATEVSTVYRLAQIAGETLEHVYTGNC